jgi:hypothetical protein
MNVNPPNPKLSLAAAVERVMRAHPSAPVPSVAFAIVEELTALNVLDTKALLYRDELVTLYKKLTTARELGVLDFDRIKTMLANDAGKELPEAVVTEVEQAWAANDFDRAVETLATAAFPFWNVLNTRKSNPLTTKDARLHQVEFAAYLGDNGAEPYIGATVRAERAHLGLLAAALCVLYYVYYPGTMDQLQDLAGEGPAPSQPETLFGAEPQNPQNTDGPIEEMPPGVVSVASRAAAKASR